MIDRAKMGTWVVAALKRLGGRAHFIEIAKQVWSEHESDIRADGDYFYKWQYEMRWAGDELAKDGSLKKGDGGRGFWGLRGTAAR